MLIICRRVRDMMAVAVQDLVLDMRVVVAVGPVR
jgi:hypothetical protein